MRNASQGNTNPRTRNSAPVVSIVIFSPLGRFETKFVAGHDRHLPQCLPSRVVWRKNAANDKGFREIRGHRTVRAVVWVIVIFVSSTLATHADPQSFRRLQLGGYQVRWQPEARGEVVLRYQIADSAVTFEGAVNCGSLAPFQTIEATANASRHAVRAELAAAFRLWSEVAAIRFEETTSFDNADIVIGAQGRPVGRAFAQVFFDEKYVGQVKPITKAVICLNPTAKWKIGYDGDLNIYDLRHTLAHEIGHAIGLDHPPTAGHLMWFKYDERFRGLSVGDVAGAQAVYGVPNHAKSTASTRMRAGG